MVHSMVLSMVRGTWYIPYKDYSRTDTGTRCRATYKIIRYGTVDLPVQYIPGVTIKLYSALSMEV